MIDYTNKNKFKSNTKINIFLLCKLKIFLIIKDLVYFIRL